MKVKKYNAPTMSSALEKIRAELGQDAVIINSKVLYTGGFLGFFKKKSIEVVAAVDPEMEKLEIPTLKNKKVMPQPKSVNLPDKEVFADLVKMPVLSSASGMEAEITEIKKMVKSLNTTKQIALHENVQKITELLTEQEISAEVIDDIVLLLSNSLEKESLTYAECLELTKTFMLTKLPSVELALFQKKFINVVGPTGVGKTTTIAKLAAESAIKYGKKIAFITTDTYRIAAIEQLKTYATILNIPIEVAYNLEDFQKATEKFSHYDLVFIDTAGRNFRNKEYVKELRNIIDFEQELETYLVLALTSKQRDMEAIVNQFSLIPITHFIFTKMDETASLGSMFNMVESHNVSVAYVTNGQNVPDDIVKTTSAIIVQSILEGVDNGRSS
ncbi:MAG: flagellar biosynthesis protein FlhF [Bacillus sp. (in: firmicutes)]